MNLKYVTQEVIEARGLTRQEALELEMKHEREANEARKASAATQSV